MLRPIATFAPKTVVADPVYIFFAACISLYLNPLTTLKSDNNINNNKLLSNLDK